MARLKTKEEAGLPVVVLHVLRALGGGIVGLPQPINQNFFYFLNPIGP